MDIRKAKASELALPASVPTRFVPKQYQPKVKRQVTRRHNDDSDVSGVESGDDDDSDGLLDSGELDPSEFSKKHPTAESFEQSCVVNQSDGQPCSPNIHEALYDVAGLPEGVTPSDQRPGNSNNNNGGVEPLDNYEPMDKPCTLRPAVTDSSTNIHESLYDLVGKINAGEMDNQPAQNGAHCRTQSLVTSPVHGRNNSSSSSLSMSSQPPLQQDFYEPIQEHVNGSVASSIKNQPLPPVPQATATQSLPPQSLSSPPPGDVYEAIGSISPPPLNLYEEIEKSDSRLSEAMSSDDESPRHQLSAANPAIPPKSSPPLPPREDKAIAPPPPALPPRNDDSLQTEYGNAPSLPAKEVMISPSKPPLRPPLVYVGGGGNPSLSEVSPLVYDEVPDNSISNNGDAEGDIYDDATSMSAPSAQTTSTAIDQEDIYDDATSLASSSDSKLSSSSSSSPKVVSSKSRQPSASDSVAQQADHSSQSAENKLEHVEETGKLCS